MDGLPGQLRAGDPGLEARVRVLFSAAVQRAPVRAKYIEEVQGGADAGGCTHEFRNRVAKWMLSVSPPILGRDLCPPHLSRLLPLLTP